VVEEGAGKTVTIETNIIVSPKSKRALEGATGIVLHTRPRRHLGDLLFVTDVESAFTELRRVSEFTDDSEAQVTMALYAVGKVDVFELIDVMARAGRDHVASYFAPDMASCRRMILAHKHHAADKLIASASVRDQELVVWSCEPKQYVVSLRELPGVKELSKKARAVFEIDEDGSRLHWPEGDVDLDLDVVRYHCDDAFRRQRDRKTRESLRGYGKAIAKIRKEHGLTQSNISGLAARQVRRLEAGLVVPHASTMSKLAAAHGMTLEDYLDALANQS
jgi:hypothetical protein